MFGKPHTINVNINLKGFNMSDLTDAMTAALANLESKLTGVTTDEIVTQVHAVVDPQIASLNSTLSAIQTSQASDEQKLADVTAAVTQFTTAFAPAPMPEPAPEPAPAA